MIHYLKRGAEAAIVAAVKIYQWLLSPLMPPSCRFTPTCSQYAIEAVKCHGPARGLLLAVWRLARCHPFSAGGYDPVPQPRHCRSTK